MNISHYPSLELCKKLTEAGFPDTEMGYFTTCCPSEIARFIKNHQVYVCPSVMELLDELPADIIENYRLYVKKCSAKSIYKENDEYIVYYRNTESGEQK